MAAPIFSVALSQKSRRAQGLKPHILCDPSGTTEEVCGKTLTEAREHDLSG
jgi:hypothetical protein